MSKNNNTSAAVAGKFSAKGLSANAFSIQPSKQSRGGGRGKTMGGRGNAAAGRWNGFGGDSEPSNNPF